MNFQMKGLFPLLIAGLCALAISSWQTEAKAKNLSMSESNAPRRKSPPAPQIAGPSLISAQSSPTAVVAGDFDGSGWLDLAVAEDQVVLYVNDGQGRFETARQITASKGYTMLAAADFNGDGSLDLVAGDGSGKLGILINRRKGHFELGQTLTSPWAWGIVAADFDGVKGPDLATVNRGAKGGKGSINLMLNNGRGQLGAPKSYPIDNAFLTCIAAGDFDGANGPDLAVGSSTGSVFMFVNQGDGRFVQSQEITGISGAATVGLTVADFDSLNGVDLAASTSKGVFVWLNTGSGLATEARNVYSTSCNMIASADLNEDGAPDLISTLGQENSMVALLNDGVGGFPNPSNFALGAYPWSIACADFDGAGGIDIAVANVWGNSLSISFNRGGGVFDAPTTEAGLHPMAVAVADFNGDGQDEAAVANEDNEVRIYSSDGDGSVRELGSFESGRTTISNYPDLCESDLNLDGNPDLVISDRFLGLSVLENLGEPLFGPPRFIAMGDATSPVAGDLDGQNGPDIVYADVSEDSILVMISKNAGKLTYDKPVSYTVGSQPVDVVLADLDGKNGLDLIVANQSSWDVSQLFNQGDGTFGEPVSLSCESSPSALVSADFDGKNGPDLAVASFKEPEVWIYLNQGGGVLKHSSTLISSGQSSLSENMIRAADVNGDGLVDLISSGTGGLNVYSGYGDGAFTAAVRYGVASRGLGIGDLDGNGSPDVVLGSLWDSITVLYQQ